MTTIAANSIDYPHLYNRVPENLVDCPRQYVGSASRWTRLAHHLDDISDELIFITVRAFSGRFVAMTPELSDLAHQAPSLAVDAELQIMRVRSRIREASGTEHVEMEVRGEVREVLRRVHLPSHRRKISAASSGSVCMQDAVLATSRWISGR